MCDFGSAARGTAAEDDVAGGLRSRDLDTSQRSSDRRFSRGCCAIVGPDVRGLPARGLPQLSALRSSGDETTTLLLLAESGLQTHASGENDVRSRRATRSVHNPPPSENTRSSVAAARRVHVKPGVSTAD